MKTIYLCGAINGCTDAECRNWRNAVKAELSGVYDFRDPMRRDYRGREDESVNEIVRGDYADIDASDIVLAAADKPSWGTAMEIHYSFSTAKKQVIAVCGAERVSPWLRYHTNLIFPSLSYAITHLRSYPERSKS